mmetsp:Transcript_16619/g.62944  ORF Transcript_16619/g.62944 Transcript_16619/m.62944 type:complete len:1038 (+) Transcript_16619:2506-5619(+)
MRGRSGRLAGRGVHHGHDAPLARERAVPAASLADRDGELVAAADCAGAGANVSNGLDAVRGSRHVDDASGAEAGGARCLDLAGHQRDGVAGQHGGRATEAHLQLAARLPLARAAGAEERGDGAAAGGDGRHTALARRAARGGHRAEELRASEGAACAAASVGVAVEGEGQGGELVVELGRRQHRRCREGVLADRHCQRRHGGKAAVHSVVGDDGKLSTDAVLVASLVQAVITGAHNHYLRLEPVLGGEGELCNEGSVAAGHGVGAGRLQLRLRHAALARARGASDARVRDHGSGDDLHHARHAHGHGCSGLGCERDGHSVGRAALHGDEEGRAGLGVAEHVAHVPRARVDAVLADGDARLRGPHVGRRVDGTDEDGLLGRSSADRNGLLALHAHAGLVVVHDVHTQRELLAVVRGVARLAHDSHVGGVRARLRDLVVDCSHEEVHVLRPEGVVERHLLREDGQLVDRSRHSAHDLGTGPGQEAHDEVSGRGSVGQVGLGDVEGLAGRGANGAVHNAGLVVVRDSEGGHGLRAGDQGLVAGVVALQRVDHGAELEREDATHGELVVGNLDGNAARHSSHAVRLGEGDGGARDRREAVARINCDGRVRKQAGQALGRGAGDRGAVRVVEACAGEVGRQGHCHEVILGVAGELAVGHRRAVARGDLELQGHGAGTGAGTADDEGGRADRHGEHSRGAAALGDLLCAGGGAHEGDGRSVIVLDRDAGAGQGERGKEAAVRSLLGVDGHGQAAGVRALGELVVLDDGRHVLGHVPVGGREGQLCRRGGHGRVAGDVDHHVASGLGREGHAAEHGRVARGAGGRSGALLEGHGGGRRGRKEHGRDIGVAHGRGDARQGANVADDGAVRQLGGGSARGGGRHAVEGVRVVRRGGAHGNGAGAVPERGVAASAGHGHGHRGVPVGRLDDHAGRREAESGIGPGGLLGAHHLDERHSHSGAGHGAEAHREAGRGSGRELVHHDAGGAASGSHEHPGGVLEVLHEHGDLHGGRRGALRGEGVRDGHHAQGEGAVVVGGGKLHGAREG